MNVEAIGTFAGEVWNALNDANGALELKAIKKATKLREKEIFAAIGWLAREGKVTVEADEALKQVDVKLL